MCLNVPFRSLGALEDKCQGNVSCVLAHSRIGARRPAACTEDALPVSYSTINIASRAEERKGKAALWSR